MQATIISYLPGMFGEFFASCLEKTSSVFYRTTVTKDENNRYFYPNYLDVISFEFKNYPSSKQWNITSENLKLLHEIYKEKNICLPTHWYNELPMTKLPCQGIRICAETEKILKLSYAMWWLKSHLFSNKLWHQRRLEIDEMISKNTKHTNNLLKLRENYQNWKFLSYKFNTLTNNEPNLTKYFYVSYIQYKKENLKILKNYQLMKAESILVENPDYFQQNLNLLKDKLGIDYEDNLIIKRLFEYVKEYLKE